MNSALSSVDVTGGPIYLQSGASFTDNFPNGGSDLFPGVVLAGATTFSLTATTEGLHFTGAVTGTGPLALSNTGLSDGLQLTTASSYTGATTISGSSEVQADVNGAVPTGGALTVDSGSKLKFGASSTVGSLAGAGTVSMPNSGTRTGTLTLSGANTYAGATTVSAGTLSVTGSTASSALSLTGGTLEGTGTTGAVTATGGTVQPGTSSTGVLSTGALSMDSSSTFAVRMNGTSAGTNYDRLAVNGSVSLGSATLAPTLGFPPAAGQVFTVIHNLGGGAVSGTFAGLPEGSTFTVGSRVLKISYVGVSGHDVTLTVQASSSGGGSGGGGGGSSSSPAAPSASISFPTAGGTYAVAPRASRPSRWWPPARTDSRPTRPLPTR